MNTMFYQSINFKRAYLILLTVILMIPVSFSQTLHQYHQCGNDVKQFIQQHPEFLQAYENFEANWKDAQQQMDLSSFERTASGKYIIPVVVHVLHLGGTENISSAQVKSQITAMNEFFAMESSNLSMLSSHAFDTVVPYFNGGDSCFVSGPGSQLLNRFEFRLATKDPNGNCTDGIVRVYTEKAEMGEDATRFKSKSYWDRSKYFNMWVVKTFSDPQLLGYAQFPFAFGSVFPLTSTDGVAMLHNFYGTTGTAAGTTGATPTHEAGHWLGLFHIWGDEECGNDGIDDTPIHFGPNFTAPDVCPAFPKPALCYNDTATTDSALNAYNLTMHHEVGEQWMNFMDYTDNACQWMFSEGQYRKMNVTMETVSFRGSLSSPTNILASGTDDQSQSGLCHAAPIADLWSRDGSNEFIVKKLICAGGDLTYRDGTFNLSNPGSVAHTRSWDLPGGTPNTSTSTNPVIVYNTPGDYTATLTSTNTDGTSTKTWTDYVHVSSPIADQASYIYYDDFEYSTSLYEQGKWINLNQGINAANGWEQTTATGYMSSKCMVMKNEDNIIYEEDFLISPSFDMTTMANEKLYFKFAGARKTAMPWVQQKDQLRVYFSTNCGENWTLRQINVDGVNRTYLSGDTLYTAGLITGSFVPTNAAQWNEGVVDIGTPYNTASNFRVMFVWTSGGPYGNDFYLDQVNISNSQAIGIEENKVQFNYNVYPNPITGVSQVYFGLDKTSQVKIDVVDMTGRVVLQVYSGELQAGDQTIQLNRSDFNTAGVYMVRLTVNGESVVKKVIIR